MAYNDEGDTTVLNAPEEGGSALAQEQDLADRRELQQIQPSPGGYALPQRTGLTRAVPPTPLAVRAQPRVSFADIDPNAKPLAVYGRPAPPPPEQGIIGNSLDVMWKGVQSNWADIMGAARFAEQQLSSDPETKTWIERQRESVEGEIAKGYSDPKLQKIMSASLMSLFGGNTDAKGNHIPSPGEVGWFNYFHYNTMAMVPTVVLALLPATVTAKLATKVMSSLGAVAKTAKAVGTGFGVGESALQGGAQNMGVLYNSVADVVKHASEAEMMKSPAYAEFRRGGYSDEAAKAELIKQTIPPMALQAFGVGGLAGAGATSILARGAASPIASTGLRNRALGAAVGATEMGGLMAGQAGVTTALGQQAEQGIGIREGYDTDAIRANAVAAGLGGAGMGAVFGAIHPPRPRARPTPDVSPDVAGALDAALPPPEPPEPPAPPTSPMPPPPPPDPRTPGQMEFSGMSPQGEMFSGAETGLAPRQPIITGVQPGMPPEAQQGGLFDPGVRITQPPPTQGEMFPREPPPPTTAVEPPPGPTPPPGSTSPPGPTPPPPGPTPPPPRPGPTPPPPRTPAPDISAYASMKKTDLIDALRTHGETVNPNESADRLRIRLARVEAERGASTGTPPDTTGVTSTTGEAVTPRRDSSAPSATENSLPSASAGVEPATTVLDRAWLLKAGSAGEGEGKFAGTGYDMKKGADALTAEAEKALAAGHTVELVTDQGRKTVPITHIKNGMLADAKGQAWGTASLATDGTGKEGLRITRRVAENKAAGVGPEPRVTELEGEAAATRDFRPGAEPEVLSTLVAEPRQEVQNVSAPAPRKETKTQEAQRKREELRTLGVKNAGKMKLAKLNETYDRVMREQEELTRGHVPPPVEAPAPTKAVISTEVEAPVKKVGPKAAEKPKGRQPPKTTTVVIERKANEPKPYVAEEVKAEPTAEEAQAARSTELARDQALEDISFVTRTVVGEVPPGTPKGAAMRKAVEDLGRLVNLTDGSREDITRMTHALMEPRAGEPEVATQARQEVARAYYEKNIGKKFGEAVVDPDAEPTRGEVSVVREEEQTRGATEGPAKAEDVETKAVGGGEGESAGLTMGLETKNKEVTQATDVNRTSADWINKILDPTDRTTATEAASQYDPKNNMGRPRSEGFRTMAEALDTEINRVTNEENASKDREALRKSVSVEIKGTPGTDAYDRAVARKDAREAKLEAKLADFAPERVEQLRAARRELVDPVGVISDEAKAMADRAALKGAMGKRNVQASMRDTSSAPEPPLPITNGIDPRSSRGYKLATDHRLGANLVRWFQSREGRGETPMSHDAYRLISTDPIVTAEAPELAALARRLIDLAPNVPIHSGIDTLQRGWMMPEHFDPYFTGRLFGYSDMNVDPKVPRHIMLDPENITNATSNHSVIVMLHEGLHSATQNYIYHLEQHEPWHFHIQALDLIREELTKRIGGAKNAHPGESGDVRYAVKNNHELVSELMTNSQVQAAAMTGSLSPEFREGMKFFGFAPRGAKSVWAYFTHWVRKSLGFSPPKSASEYTLLDYALRPMQEIIEHGSKFQKAIDAKYLPAEPRLREAAIPLARMADEAFSGRTSRLAERAYHAVGDRLGATKAHALLQSIHLDRMVDSFGHVMQDGDVNHIKEVRAVMERADVAGQRFLKDFAGEAGEITRELVKHDDVAALMNDAGYARAALGTREPAQNAHLTSAEDRAQLAALQTRFDTMPAEKQALYTKTRDFLTKKYAFERQAVADNLVNRFMPNATDAEKALMRTTMASKTRLDAFLADPDNAGIADERKRIAKGMAKLTRMGFVDGDYFPMRRYGDFAVEYGGAHGTPEYGVQFFEKKSEAAAFRAQQIADNVADVGSVRERHEIVTQNKGRLSPVVEDMIDAVRRDPAFSRAQADQLEEMAGHLQLRYASGWEKATARRRYVAGASKDVARAINTDVSATSRRIGTIMHGGERDAAFERMKHFVDEKGRDTSNPDNTTRDRIYHELQQRFQRGDELDQTGGWGIARRFAQFGYAQNLLSLSRAPVETYEMTSKMLTFIGARYGYGRGALELGRALTAIGPQLVGKGGKNTIDALIGKPLSSANYKFTEIARQRFLDRGYDRSEVDALFKHFEANGLWGNTEGGFLRELSRPTKLGGAWDRFLEISSALTQATDEMGRIAGTMAAFKTARGKGVSVPDAINFAEDTLRKAPNYSSTNRARITTEKGSLKGAAPAIMQFKMYGLNESWLIANMMRNSFGPGVDKAVRIEAAKQLAGTFMMHSLAAGVLTWMADPVRYLGGAIDLLTGHTPKERMSAMRSWLADTMGPTMGEVVGAGVPHAFGVDMQHRLGVNNMFNLPQLNGYAPKDFVEAAGTFVFGSPGGATVNVMSGFMKMLQGGLSGGLHDMASGAAVALPRVLRDPIKAGLLADRGVVDPRGKEILAPEKISPLDVGYQALGFAPSRVTEAREGRQAIVQARQQVADTRSRLVRRWLEADPGDRAAVWSEIAQYNASREVNLGSKITRDQLLQQLNERRKGKLHPGAFGLRLPKASERQLMEYGAFANH